MCTQITVQLSGSNSWVVPFWPKDKVAASPDSTHSHTAATPPPPTSRRTSNTPIHPVRPTLIRRPHYRQLAAPLHPPPPPSPLVAYPRFAPSRHSLLWGQLLQPPCTPDRAPRPPM